MLMHAGQSLGLVENWSQVDWNKVAYLEALGYTPWWLTPTPPSTDLSGRPISVTLSTLSPVWFDFTSRSLSGAGY